MRQDIKLGDLAPWPDSDRPGLQPLKTLNFNVYIFEVPAAKIDGLDGVWRMLQAGEVRLEHREAFRANSFAAGFGRGPMLRRVLELLDGADGRRIQTVSLLLADGRSSDFPVAGLPGRQTIFYTSGDGSAEGRAVGPGELALRMRAERIGGLRGICSFRADAVFSPPVTSPIPELAARAKSEEFVFESVGFDSKMVPGDFFLLGPAKHVEDPMTLAGHFFSRPAPALGIRMFWVPPSSVSENPQPYFGPVVRTYLVYCMAIND